jgi:predicted SAM-dependent methyltransferase
MSVSESRMKLNQPYVDYNPARHLMLRIESFIGHTLFRRLPPKSSAHPRLLHLGCGNEKFDGWVNADFYNFHDILYNRDSVPDWMLDLTRPIRCPDGYWDGVFTEHTFEHLTYSECFFALSEVHRILREGAWLRIVVPDIAKYVAYYLGTSPDEQFNRLPKGPEAISNVTQCWGHKSVWDASLLCNVLREIGYANVREAAFNDGTDRRLIKDSAHRAWESLYVEGQRTIQS